MPWEEAEQCARLLHGGPGPVQPILNLDTYVPAIQAKMREKHFPDFKQDIVQRLVLPFGTVEPNRLAAPAVTPQSRYQFGDISGGARFVLETTRCRFRQQTTIRSKLSETLLAGLGVMHDALHLDFIERIGLRYLDAVQPLGENESLRDFLVQEVLGLSLRPDVQLQHSVSETVVATQARQLVSRVLIRHGQVGLPLELTALSPNIAPRFTQHIGLHAIIDTDASTTQRETFDLASVGTQLTALHDEIDKCFKAIVTEHALAAWA